MPEDAARLLSAEDLRGVFSRRKRATHKGDYGHLLIVAGSVGMAGAAALATKAALHSGVGLVTVACPQSIVTVIQCLAPCAMCVPLPDEDGHLTDESAEVLAKILPGKTAFSVGPGLTTKMGESVIRTLLDSTLPGAIDADALNIVARSEELKERLCDRHVITPHPGEARRLLGRPVGNAMEDARALRDLGAVALLKGAATVICGQKCTVSASGTPGMAKGGSGDVLTGFLGGFLAQGMEPEWAACVASEIHGLAGEEAARCVGERYMTAEDIISGWQKVCLDLETSK